MSDLFFVMAFSKSWFLDIFRTLFALIDYVVYGVLQILFKTIFNIANFELDVFAELIMDRVYVILGIFMLFKVTVSFITYLVNPDKISDKEQGLSKVIIRIILVLVMLIGIPTFFDLMTEFQNKLLPVIPRIVLVTEATSEDSDVAVQMTDTLLHGFIPNDCSDDSDTQLTLDTLIDNINEECGDTGRYKYHYSFIVSSLVGIAMVYVLVSMCINVAIRAFKLIILKAIAPIPIISYVDPKSSKDGAFSHWTKTLLTTWAELFIHMAIIYFIMAMIEVITDADFLATFFGATMQSSDNVLEWVLLLSFLIIGLLFFAKSAPKFIFDALGIKNSGGFTRMLGMGATAIGMGGSVASQFAARQKENPGHGLTNFGASLFGGLASGVAGGNALLTSDKPTWRTGIDAQQKNTARDLNRIASHSTASGRTSALLSSLFTGQTPADRYNHRIELLENADKKLNDYKSTANSRFEDSDDFTYTIGTNANANFKLFNQVLSAAENGDADAKAKLTKDYGFKDMFEAREKYKSIHDSGLTKYMHDTVNKVGNYDKVLYSKYEYAKDATDGLEVDIFNANGEVIGQRDLAVDYTDLGNVKGSLGEIDNTKRAIVISDKYKSANADSKESKKGS